MSNEEALDFYDRATRYERVQLGHILGEAVMGAIKHEDQAAEDWTAWRNVIAEESGEVLEAIGAHRASLAHGTQGKSHLKRELQQLAAACMACIAHLDGETLLPDPHVPVEYNDKEDEPSA